MHQVKLNENDISFSSSYILIIHCLGRATFKVHSWPYLKDKTVHIHLIINRAGWTSSDRPWSRSRPLFISHPSCFKSLKQTPNDWNKAADCLEMCSRCHSLTSLLLTALYIWAVSVYVNASATGSSDIQSGNHWKRVCVEDVQTTSSISMCHTSQ